MDSCLKVAIIVPCRNEEQALGSFLLSLDGQDLDGIQAEVLIADGGSTDGSREILQQYCSKKFPVRVVDNPRGIVSAGLNEAIRSTDAGIILRMDVHTEYRHDYVRRCLEELEKTGAANVGGPARTRHGNSAIARAIATAYHSPFACGGARFHNIAYAGYVDTVPYGCWRRSTFGQVGLFDESLVRNQDDEFNLRLLLHGLKIWQSPDIVSWYYPRPSLQALFRQYLQYGFWKVAVLRRHGRTASVRHYVPAIFVSALLMLPAAALVALLADFRGMAALAGAGWLAATGAYALASFGVALLAVPSAGFKAASLLPVVCAAYHVSYGLGFLAGLLGGGRQRGKYPLPDLFSGLTR